MRTGFVRLDISKKQEELVIESVYVYGVAIPSFDSAVSDVVNSYKLDSGGKPMKIAIENAEGKIYRVLTTLGLGAYMHAVSRLAEVGLDDTLADSMSGKSGYDSWFVATPQMLAATATDEEIPIDAASDILGDLEDLRDLPETERQAIVLSRVGQGIFRKKLVGYWKGCAVTGADCIPLLRASHIKPWRESTNVERLDAFNGLLLSPNIDAAFDAGYITFDQNGRILLSEQVHGSPAFQLHINAKMKINAKLIRDEHRAYLEYHRSEVFKG